MEEVDNIIIDSLRTIDCDIDESVSNLKSFSDDDVVHAISCCLKAIKPSESTKSLPNKMPTTMSAKLKLATNLVEQIKNLGFKGDIGYQSILYFNEIEIRRVFMFLIERIPKDSSKLGAATESVGYVPTLVKQIEDKVRKALNTPWFPPGLSQNSVQGPKDSFFMSNYKNCIPLRSKPLETPCTQSGTEDLKEFWVHHLPQVSKQCSKDEFIPSLLFDDMSWTNIDKLKEYLKTHVKDMGVQHIEEFHASQTQINEIIQTNVETPNQANDLETKISNALKEINAQKDVYKETQNAVKERELALIQLKESSEKLERTLKEASNKLKIKSRTLTVLSKEENLEKLQSLVENGNERLLDLENQWNQVQTPLLEQYKTLQTSLSDQELKARSEHDKNVSLINKIRQVEDELLVKNQLEKKLQDDCSQINVNTNRAAYTKRILEIISNIKKQDGDISNILKDTKDIQKEINTLSGQLDRSFTLSDSLIFKDAKVDDVAKKCYKLLANLHMDCESIIQAVTDIGLIERECRNVQDQIDAENSKDIGTKLKRVLIDIEEIKKENV